MCRRHRVHMPHVIPLRSAAASAQPGQPERHPPFAQRQGIHQPSATERSARRRPGVRIDPHRCTRVTTNPTRARAPTHSAPARAPSNAAPSRTCSRNSTKAFLICWLSVIPPSVPATRVRAMRSAWGHGFHRGGRPRAPHWRVKRVAPTGKGNRLHSGFLLPQLITAPNKLHRHVA